MSNKSIIKTISAAAMLLFGGLLNACNPASNPLASSGDLEKSCEAGKAAACTRVGTRMAFGTFGYKKNYKTARVFLKKGCDGGHLQGCKDLGVLYHFGRGVERDYLAAGRLYERACDAKIANACHYLGTFYRFGRGYPKNADMAKQYYAKACAAGSKSSCKYVRAE